MKKRFLTLFIAIVMVMTMLPVTALTAFAATTYTVTVDSTITHGTITASPTTAAEGDTVTLTVTPDTDYSLASATLKVSDGTNEIELTSGANDTYTFTMPAANVTVSARFGIPNDGLYYVNDTDIGVTTIFGSGALSASSWQSKVLSKVVIEEGIDSIGVNAFRAYSSLESITIPASVASIGAYVFQGCSSLTDVTYLGTSEPTISASTFTGCDGLSSVTVPAGYTGSTFGGITVVKSGASTTPTVTGVSFNDSSAAYNSGTNTFNVSDTSPFILTITGENLTELTGDTLRALFYGDAQGSGGVIISVTVESDTRAYVSVNTSKLTYILSNAVGAGSASSTKATSVEVKNGDETVGTVNVNLVHATTTPEITDIILSDYNGNGVVEVDTSNKRYTVTIPEGESDTRVTVTVKGNNLDKITTENEGSYLVSVKGSGTILKSSYLQPTGDMQFSLSVASGFVGNHTVKYSTDGGASWTETGWTVEVKQTITEPEITDIIISDRDGNGVVEVDAQNKKYIVTIPAGESGTKVTVTVKGNNLDKITTENEGSYLVSVDTSSIILLSTYLQPAGDMQILFNIASVAVGTHIVKYSTDGGVTWTETGWTVEIKQGTAATTPEYATKAELAEAVDNLQNLINSNTATIGQINQALADVNNALADIKADYATQDMLNSTLNNFNSTLKNLSDWITEVENDVTVNTVDIASLNGRVQIISNTVNELAVDVPQLSATVDGLTASLNTLTTDLAALADRVGVNETNIADLQTQVSELEAAIAELEAADTDLGPKLQDVISKIDTLKQSVEATYATKEELKAAEDALKKADEALAAAVEQLTRDLAAANDRITVTEGDIATNTGAIADLADKMNQAQDAIAALQTSTAATQAQLDALEKAFDEAKTALEATDKVLQDNIDTVKGELDQSVADLNETIKKGDEALGKRITAISSSLSAARKALEQADADNKAELIAKIEAAEAALDAAVKAVQKNLDDAKAELNKALADGDKSNADALAQAITDLNAAIDAAEAAAEAADGALKEELVAKIDSTEDALEKAIEALAAELGNAKSELESKDSELKTFIIIVCVISGVAFCGCIALTIWIFDTRRKLTK